MAFSSEPDGNLDNLLSREGEGSAGSKILDKSFLEVNSSESINTTDKCVKDLNKKGNDQAEAVVEAESEAAEAEARRQLAALSVPQDSVVPARIVALAAAEETSNTVMGRDQQKIAQDTFGELLKASMEEAEAAGKGSDIPMDIKKRTIDAISEGDIESLEVKSLLGDTMTMLTERLGIDMAAELSDAKSQGDMKAIIAGGMSELASNMRELDEKSEELYQQLGSLEQELRAETEAFNNKKSEELQELLGKQASFQRDVEASRIKVEASTAQLQGLMADLEEKLM